MKILPIIAAVMMTTMGTYVIAQTNTSPSNSDKLMPSESQRGPRGPQFRGGREMPKEIHDCSVCQEYRNHMKDKHPNFVGQRGQGKGPMGPPPPRPEELKDASK